MKQQTFEVYKITNKVNNKIYIGMTNQGSGARYRHHWYESRTGDPTPIHRAMAKYGEENFTLEIIDFADNYEDLKKKEIEYIAKYNSTDRSIGYNLTPGGDGTSSKRSEETRKRISEAAKKRPPASEETRRKISEANKGRKMTALTYQKSQERNALRAKAVLQYDKDMNFIAEYSSISEAAKATGIDRSTIQKQLNNTTILKSRHLIKYIWKLKDQSNLIESN